MFASVKIVLIILFSTELLRRVENSEAESAEDIALMLFRTATIRSGFILQDTEEFADTVDQMMRRTLGIENEQFEEEEEEEIPETGAEDESAEKPETGDEEADAEGYEHEEL